MKHPVIALDGPAGSGKSTVAKILAKELGFPYLDSGALYRGLTFVLWNQMQKKPLESQSFPHFTQTYHQAIEKADTPESLQFWEIPLSLRFGNQGENQIFWEDRNISQEIRTPELTQSIRYVADKPRFRDFVNEKIRAVADRGPLVLDGRDIGTVVFPESQAKFFLTASSEVRALRRQKEWQAQGKEIELSQLIQDIESRDRSDSEREVAPLRQASDAIPIDTSNLSTEAVVKAILSQLSLSGQI